MNVIGKGIDKLGNTSIRREDEIDRGMVFIIIVLNSIFLRDQI